MTTHALVGLAAGIAVGLFFGDDAALFGVLADGFVKLLQMAVLPYVTVSIVGGIGGLAASDLRVLSVRGALVLVALWAIAITFTLLMPLVFPEQEGASFFSTRLLEPAARLNLVDLYIPANPFNALANNIVPAVVVFSIATGVALIGLPQRQVLLGPLQAVRDTLGRVMKLVVNLTPYGLFAIAASAAGTLRFEEAMRLQVYLVAYGAFAVLLALWVLPGLVAALTSISARSVFKATREPVLTAAVVGDLFVVLPLLTAACRGLIAKHVEDDAGRRSLPDVIVPASFNFPHSGKLLSASFVLFAGWFSDVTVPLSDYPRLAATALLTLFGSTTAAMPFLLDLFRIPADTLELFIASSVINSRFGTLVAAMHTVAVALLCTCAVTGLLQWRPRALARYAVATIVLTAGVVGGVRLLAERVLWAPSPAGDVLDRMQIDQQGQFELLAAVAPVDDPAPPGGRLAAIGRRRAIRACYLPDALPFAFRNGGGELVGYDVALMHRLALELSVTVQFATIGAELRDHVTGAPTLLERGFCDIVIGGLAVTTARAGSMHLSESYLDETLGFIVVDAARREFVSWETIRNSGPLVIAVPDVPYYVDKLQKRLPNARLLSLPANRLLERLEVHAVDAVALPAERGSAWTLRRPEFSMVVPKEAIKVPLALAMPRGEPELAEFVNTFLDLKRKDGTLDALYEYWILGRTEFAPAPRWSIIRDVLHWIE